MQTVYRWDFYVNIKKIVNKEFFGMIEGPDLRN